MTIMSTQIEIKNYGSIFIKWIVDVLCMDTLKSASEMVVLSRFHNQHHIADHYKLTDSEIDD